MRSTTDPTEKPPQDRNRDLESYINSGRPAPQPDLNRNIGDMLEREHGKRRNQP
ncbi:hypothetical protein JOE51_006784 [Bradyrhizobium japonicum]|uniref:hypothetical protein n=1 Tax=Bradyrhizobium diazoefficiens TaxID=1355477 RepID=UPI001B536DC3|nr:hypothetical protein [Bradyrhizobium japonicum]